MEWDGSRPTSPWLTTLTTYEGERIALRVRPHANTPEHRARFPRLVAIFHDLTEVRSDGLPESDYNDTLAPLDRAVFESLEAEAAGLVVIVETFSGRRIYYAYVRPEVPVEALFATLQGSFLEHALRLKGRIDREWDLYDHYRKQFGW